MASLLVFTVTVHVQLTGANVVENMQGQHSVQLNDRHGAWRMAQCYLYIDPIDELTRWFSCFRCFLVMTAAER